MLNLFSRKKQCSANYNPRELEVLLAKIAQIYRIEEINPERKKYLTKKVKRKSKTKMQIKPKP